MVLREKLVECLVSHITERLHKTHRLKSFRTTSSLIVKHRVC
jgi:hypothetical protein